MKSRLKAAFARPELERGCQHVDRLPDATAICLAHRLE